MKARRFSRMASRPRQSATPRLPMASSVKQSKPLPKVLSSISFQKASSHSGGVVFVIVSVVIAFSLVDIDQLLYCLNIAPLGTARNYLRGNLARSLNRRPNVGSWFARVRETLD